MIQVKKHDELGSAKNQVALEAEFLNIFGALEGNFSQQTLTPLVKVILSFCYQS